MILGVVEIGHRPQLLNHMGAALHQLIHMMQYLLEGTVEHLVMRTVMHLLMGKEGRLVLHLMTHLKVCEVVKVVCMMDLLMADIATDLFLLLSDHLVTLDWFDCDFAYSSQYH